MNGKSIEIFEVVTLSSDDDEKSKEEEKKAPTPPPPPIIRPPNPDANARRQSTRKKPSRVRYIKSSSSEESDDASNKIENWSSSSSRSNISKSQQTKTPSISSSVRNSDCNRNSRGHERQRQVSDEEEEYVPSYETGLDKTIPINCDEDLPGLQTQLIDLNAKRQMYCPVCQAIFKKKSDFVLHRRRHVGPDHFICATCQRGFSRLKACLDHEFEIHHNQGINGFKPSGRPEKQEIVPSTSLYAYRGPPIRNVFEPYEIDYNYTKPEKKNNTRENSKRVLDTQREIRENTESLVRAALLRHESQDSDDDEEAQVQVAHRSTALPPKLGKDKSSSQTHSQRESCRNYLSTMESTIYECTRCLYQARKRRTVIQHIDDKHPNIPGRYVGDYIKIKNTEEPSKEPSGNRSHSARPGSSSKNRESRNNVTERFSNISESICGSSNGSPKRPKKTKKKKITFSKRLDGIRVWEKTADPLTQPEFLSALSLINNSDVLLGPRQGLRKIESSLFCFRRVHREKSPPPHARIVLEKLPVEKTQHNRVYLCNICDFTAPSAKDVRYHRRNEHLKTVDNDETEDEPGSHVSPVRKNHTAISVNVDSVPPISPAVPPSPPPQASVIEDARNPDPDENSNAPVYKCGRCDFKSHDKRVVKAHRIVHKGSVLDKSDSSTSASSNSSSVMQTQVQLQPPPLPKVIPSVIVPPLSSNTPVEVEYQCDKCSYAAATREEVKQHRKAAHAKNIALTPARPVNNNNVNPEQRLNVNDSNDFAKPHGPPKKKLKIET